MRHCLLWTIPAFTTSTPTIAVAPRLLDQETGPNETTRNTIRNDSEQNLTVLIVFWILSQVSNFRTCPVVFRLLNSHVLSFLRCLRRWDLRGDMQIAMELRIWSFWKFHKCWWLFHKAFQILMSFSKPFLFKQMWWELFKPFAMKHQTHGFSTNLFCAQLPFFFFLLCFQEGTVKGECCEALCGAPKHHCDMSRSKHWSSARLSGKPAF